MDIDIRDLGINVFPMRQTQNKQKEYSELYICDAAGQIAVLSTQVHGEKPFLQVIKIEEITNLNGVDLDPKQKAISMGLKGFNIRFFKIYCFSPNDLLDRSLFADGLKQSYDKRFEQFKKTSKQDMDFLREDYETRLRSLKESIEASTKQTVLMLREQLETSNKQFNSLMGVVADAYKPMQQTVKQIE